MQACLISRLSICVLKSLCFCGHSSLNIRMSVPNIKHIHVLINGMHIKVVNSQLDELYNMYSYYII